MEMLRRRTRRPPATTREDDPIWDELTGSDDDDNDAEGNDVYVDDISPKQTTVPPRQAPRSTNISMKRTARIFDDVLWRDGAARTARGVDSRDDGRPPPDVSTEGFTKLLAFSEAIKRIGQLLKEGDGPDRGDELQTERLVARRLCREIEAELREGPPGTARRGEQADEQEESLRRLQHEFERMKRRFEDIDRALRERDKVTRNRKMEETRRPVTSLFGQLQVMEDYNRETSQTSREQKKAQKPAPSTRKPNKHFDAESEDGGKCRQTQLQKQISGSASASTDMDKSLESLEGELEQLLDLFRDFNELVHAQQPMVDQFEEKVFLAEEQTKSAVTELATRASYGTYSLPLVGAAVGGLVLGPLGAIAGAKGAAAVGVCVMGGMGLGAYVGRQLSAKQKQEATLILERYRLQGQEQTRQLRQDENGGFSDDEDEY